MKYLLMLFSVVAFNAFAGDVSSAPEVESLELAEPTARKPLSQKAVVFPANASAGDTVKVAIKAKLLDTWHIYAYDPTAVYKVTEHSLSLPEGVERAGDWQLPSAEPYIANPDILIYHDDLLFVQELTIGDDVPAGEMDIEVKFSYQTCDPYFCHPPKTEKQVLTLTVK